jgi:iron complex outermembrane recepter protein
MRLRIIILLLLVPLLVQGQSLTGYVKDSVTNTPLPGANVMIGSKNTLTNNQGFFKIENIPTGETKLQCIFLGYKKKQIVLTLGPNQETILEIKLEKDELFIDEVLVSASRTENPISDIPARVNLISPKIMASMPYQTIDEQLQFLPGVQVSRSFGIFSTKSSVSMRGLSGNEQARTLVLMDGVPFNKADGGSVNWNLISTNPLERVEIIKGPGSALYGGNAMGGIINVLTKKPLKSFEGHLLAEYGTYHTTIYRLNLAGIKNIKENTAFYWAANGFYQKSDGYITQSEADQKANPYIIKSNVNEKAANMLLGIKHTERLDASVSVSLYDGIRGTGEKVYQPEGNTTDYKTWLIRSNFKGKIGNIRWNASAFLINENYIRVNEFKKDDYTWYDVLSVRKDYGLLTGFSYQKGKHLLTTGFDIRNGSVDAYDRYYTSTDQVDNRGKIDFYALYFQDEISLTTGLKLLAGMRYDYSRFYGGAFIIHQPSAETSFLNSFEFKDKPAVSWGAFSPRISLQYKPNKQFRLYTSYSRGFRPSVLDDLCRTGRVRGGMKVANPDLKPEYLDNFEMGIDYFLFKNLKLSASAYYSRGKDFLYYVSTGDSIDMGFGLRPVMMRRNISGVEIYGSELELNFNPLPGMNTFANYSFTRSKIIDYKPFSTNDPINLEGNSLTDVPVHSFSAGLIIGSKIINAGISGRYNGPMYINDQNVFDEIVGDSKYPEWFTLDAKVSREFFKHLNVSFSVQNIFDKKIYDSKGAVGPGRFMTLRMEVKI